MVAAGDGGFAGPFILALQESWGDTRIILGILNDAGFRGALDVVDVGFVKRPPIDHGFESSLVIDGASVKAKGFGGKVGGPGPDPGGPGCLHRCRRGALDEASQGGLQVLGLCRASEYSV